MESPRTDLARRVHRTDDTLWDRLSSAGAVAAVSVPFRSCSGAARRRDERVPELQAYGTAHDACRSSSKDAPSKDAPSKDAPSKDAPREEMIA